MVPAIEILSLLILRPGPFDFDLHEVLLSLMSTESQGAAQTRDAGAPFDATDADIILRSVDEVNFRTYKNYLTRTLHGFDDILVRKSSRSN